MMMRQEVRPDPARRTYAAMYVVGLSLIEKLAVGTAAVEHAASHRYGRGHDTLKQARLTRECHGVDAALRYGKVDGLGEVQRYRGRIAQVWRAGQRQLSGEGRKRWRAPLTAAQLVDFDVMAPVGRVQRGKRADGAGADDDDPLLAPGHGRTGGRKGHGNEAITVTRQRQNPTDRSEEDVTGCMSRPHTTGNRRPVGWTGAGCHLSVPANGEPRNKRQSTAPSGVLRTSPGLC